MDNHGVTIHLYGYPCSGKTTIGGSLAKALGRTIILDGDYVRKHISKDLGFSKKDRIENARRIGSYTSLLNDQGFNAVVCTVAPHKKCRRLIRDHVKYYTSVFIDTPLKDCIMRDTKGMYKKAVSGEIQNFTGVHSFIDRGTPDIVVTPGPVHLQAQYIISQLAGN
jgi:adenylylsulfate kinase-like enzyme